MSTGSQRIEGHDDPPACWLRRTMDRATAVASRPKITFKDAYGKRTHAVDGRSRPHGAGSRLNAGARLAQLFANDILLRQPFGTLTYPGT